MAHNSPRILLLIGIFVIAASILPMSADAEENTKPAVTGKVVNAAGEAVAGMQVSLYSPRQKKVKTLGAGDGDKAGKPEPIFKTTTNDAGHFEFADVPAGDYLVVARQKGVGKGREKITVNSDATTEVTITLEPQKEKKKQKGAAAN